MKVEPPGGDPLRRWTASGARPRAGEDGALFRFLNAAQALASSRISARRRPCARSRSPAPTSWSRAGRRRDRSGSTRSRASAPRPRAGVDLAVRPRRAVGDAARDRVHAPGRVAARSACRGLPERGPFRRRRAHRRVVRRHLRRGRRRWRRRGARGAGHGEHVDVSLLEVDDVAAMTTTSTSSGAVRSPRARGSAQPIEIPSIEPSARRLRRLLHQHAASSSTDFLRADRAARAGARTRRWRRPRAHGAPAPSGAAIVHAWTRAHTIAEIVERATLLRIPVAPIGNGRPRRRVSTSWSRAACSRATRRRLRAAAPPYRLDGARAAAARAGAAPRRARRRQSSCATPRRPARRRGRAPALPLAGLRVVDFTAFWAGPVGHPACSPRSAPTSSRSSRSSGPTACASRRVRAQRVLVGVERRSSTARTRASATSRSTSPTARRRAAARGWSSAPTRWSRTSRRARDGATSASTGTRLAPRNPRLRLRAHAGLRARRALARPRRLRADDGAAHRPGLDDRLSATIRRASARRRAIRSRGMHAAFALLLALARARAQRPRQLVEVRDGRGGAQRRRRAGDRVLGLRRAARARRQPRRRSRHRRASTPCRGGGARWLALSVASDAQWRALVARSAIPAWARDPALATPPAGVPRTTPSTRAARALAAARAARRPWSRSSPRGSPPPRCSTRASTHRTRSSPRAASSRRRRAPGGRHARAPGAAVPLRQRGALAPHARADARPAQARGPARAARPRRRRHRAPRADGVIGDRPEGA